HVAQARRYLRNPLLVKHILHAADRQRRVGGELGGGGGGGGQGGVGGGGRACVGVGENVVDQPDLLGARGVDVLSGQRELPKVPVGQDQRQPGEAPHVGDHRQLDLADRELGIG